MATYLNDDAAHWTSYKIFVETETKTLLVAKSNGKIIKGRFERTLRDVDK